MKEDEGVISRGREKLRKAQLIKCRAENDVVRLTDELRAAEERLMDARSELLTAEELYLPDPWKRCC